MNEDDDPDESERKKAPLSDLKDSVVEDRDEETKQPEGSQTGGQSGIDSESDESDDDNIPLSALRDAIDSEGPEATGESEHFHEEGVEGEVESEAVWADLLMSDGDADGLLEPSAVEEGDDRTYQIVPTTLCHRCEFFGEPPVLHCTHEGTTIHELADMEHYRVSKCPMVGEDIEVTGREE